MMMRKALLFILLLTAAVMSPLYAQEAETGRTVAILASEKIRGDWVRSYYNSILENEIRTNECEMMLNEKFEKGGFSVIKSPVADSRKKDARKMMVVFGRYNDVSSVPNDIIVKAAGIVGLESGAVVACGVYVNEKKKRHEVCALAGCKVVDMRTKRRISTAAKEKCLPDSDRVNMGIAAIRDVCSEAGDAITETLGK